MIKTSAELLMMMILFLILAIERRSGAYVSRQGGDHATQGASKRSRGKNEGGSVYCRMPHAACLNPCPLYVVIGQQQLITLTLRWTMHPLLAGPGIYWRGARGQYDAHDAH